MSAASNAWRKRVRSLAMRHPAVVFFAINVALLLTLGCRSKHPSPAPSPLPTMIVPLGQGGLTSPSLVQSPSPSSAARGSFRCGNVRCSVGTQSCCGSEERATCVPNAPPDPPDMPQLLNSQIEACKLPPHAADVTEIARCGGSSDCESGEFCCDEFLFSGASAVVCKPAADAGVSCDYGEVCDTDKPCHDPQAVCIRRKCSKSAMVQCAGKKCDRKTHSCLMGIAYNGHPRCVENSRVEELQKEGRPLFSVDCVKHADCQSGELCRLALGSTFCQRASDGMSAVLCDTAADCPPDLCPLVQKQEIVCTRDPDSWHSLCDCR